MNRTFNFLDREKKIQKCINEEYDLIVIGGGITGAGITLDAISRGFKVLLLEKSDFASGTSSRSTKLIHGGLRYLKQFEIGLVRESGTERAVVHNLAPYLVHPEKMFLPIVKGGSFSKWSASLAISVYDMLANVRKEDRKKSLSKKASLQLEPLLKEDNLKGGILYSEYRTDDARLTIEIIKKAVELGADVFNYCEVDDLIYENASVTGCKFLDKTSRKSYIVKSKFVISAAGPWVDELRKKDKSLTAKRLRLTKGVHLVFDWENLPVKQSIYFDDFKGRMLFAIPRWGVTYVGTTDTDYNGDIDKIVCDQNDIAYILDAVNHMFDSVKLEKKHIISTWAGVRPLISEEGKSASEVSRKDEIFESDTGLLSIAGGKLTGYRKMAKRIIDLVQSKSDHVPQDSCKTGSLNLGKSSFSNYAEVRSYIEQLKEKYGHFGLSALDSEYLVSNYGKASENILEAAMEGDDSSGFEERLLKAEIRYCLEEESCWKPADFFNRRSGMLYFRPHRLTRNWNLVHDEFQKFFNWNTGQFETIKDESLSHYKDYVINA